MKKLIVIILALALILPVVSLADPDPIVGSWYVFYNASVFPETQSWMNNNDAGYWIYIFDESGDIYYYTMMRSGLVFTPQSGQIGKWIKKDNEYSISKLGYGEGFRAYFDGTDLFAQFGTNSTFYRLRRMDAFDPYNDMKY